MSWFGSLPTWGILVQARMGSTRLPNKMLSEILPGTTLLEWVLQRLLAVFPKNKVVLATTTASADDPLMRAAQGLGIGVFRGSLHSHEEVLLRFSEAARSPGWVHVLHFFRTSWSGKDVVIGCYIQLPFSTFPVSGGVSRARFQRISLKSSTTKSACSISR
jgi:hypothetical protein